MRPSIQRKKIKARKRSKLRIRKLISGTDATPRVSVFKSNRYTYAQVIDDTSGKTLCSFSTLQLEKEGSLSGVSSKSKDASEKLGAKVGELIKNLGIQSVKFDRNGYKFTGRVASVSTGIKSAGIAV